MMSDWILNWTGESDTMLTLANQACMYVAMWNFWKKNPPPPQIDFYAISRRLNVNEMTSPVNLITIRHDDRNHGNAFAEIVASPFAEKFNIVYKSYCYKKTCHICQHATVQVSYRASWMRKKRKREKKLLVKKMSKTDKLSLCHRMNGPGGR